MVANAFRVVAGAVLFSVVAADAAAQRGQQAGLGGTVTDATGAVLAGVQLTISSPQLIGGPQSTQSDATGLYRFPALLPGAYALTAMHPGFERLERSGIELPVGIAVTLDVRLHLTPVETRVDVEGVVPAIDVQSSSSPATIERALLENLPTPLSRLIVDVAELVPGLTKGVAFGGPALVMPVSVDGTSNNDPTIGFPAMNPSINWLDSMQVVSVGAPAEYGENTNARINLVTRSGSNRLSGLGEYWWTLSRWTTWGDELYEWWNVAGRPAGQSCGIGFGSSPASITYGTPTGLLDSKAQVPARLASRRSKTTSRGCCSSCPRRPRRRCGSKGSSSGMTTGRTTATPARTSAPKPCPILETPSGSTTCGTPGT